MSSKRFQLNNCDFSPDCRHGNARAIILLTVGSADFEWLAWRNFSYAVGVTITKLILTVEELDRVDFGCIT